MKIKMSLEQLSLAMTTITEVLSDRGLGDDLKNVIFKVSNGNVTLVGSSLTIMSLSDIEAEVEYADEPTDNFFVQLRAKEINEVLNNFKSLRRTKVDHILLDIVKTECTLFVFEVAVDANEEYAEKYNQTSKYRITVTRLVKKTESDILALNLDREFVIMDRDNVLLYLYTLNPTVAKETKDAFYNVIFKEDFVFTTPASMLTYMTNALGSEFAGFKLPITTANFIKSFISAEPTFDFFKEVYPSGIVKLILRNSLTTAVISCQDLTKVMDISKYMGKPDNAVILDKLYLIDIIKRMSGKIVISVALDGVNSSLKVSTEKFAQDIPVLASKGSGTFSFEISHELLTSVILAHYDLSPQIYLYFELLDNGKLVLKASDDTTAWNVTSSQLVVVDPAKMSW